MQQGEAGLGPLDHLRRRRLEPRELGVGGDAHRLQAERRIGQVDPGDLGVLERRPLGVVLGGPKPHAAARGDAAGPARPLVGGGLGDRLDAQRVEAALGIDAVDAGRAGVDHHPHPFDGDRSLGHVGRDDHLAALRRLHGPVLLGRRQRSVQGDDEEVEPPAGGDLRAGPDGPVDLVAARHEDEDVADRLEVEGPVEGLGGEVPGRHRRRAVEIADLDRIEPPRSRERRAAAPARSAEVGGHAGRVEGGAHHA